MRPACSVERPLVGLAYKRNRERIVVIANDQGRLVVAVHLDLVLGVVGADEPGARGVVGDLVAGREDVAAARAENDKSGFFVPALGGGEKRVDRRIRRCVFFLREGD